MVSMNGQLAATLNLYEVSLLVHGALCCGATAGDAAAVKMIVEKNCKALLCGTLLGKVTPISKVDSQLMRVVYLKKYSKQISANKG